MPFARPPAGALEPPSARTVPFGETATQSTPLLAAVLRVPVRLPTVTFHNSRIPSEAPDGDCPTPPATRTLLSGEKPTAST